MHIDLFDTYFAALDSHTPVRSVHHDDLAIIVEDPNSIVVREPGTGHPVANWQKQVMVVDGLARAEVRGLHLRAPKQLLPKALLQVLSSLRPSARSNGIAFVVLYRNVVAEGQYCSFDLFSYAVLHRYDHGPDVIPLLDKYRSTRLLLHSGKHWREIVDALEYPWDGEVTVEPLRA